MAGFISGKHFYHATTRKVVAVFGSLFDDIKVIRRDRAGNALNVEKVPLAYGPAQKFLSRIDERPDLTDPAMAIKLPRISFEVTSLSYDPTSKVSRFNDKLVRNPDNSVSKSAGYVPYILTFEVNILAKAQDDGLQILEQILPTFHPEYNVSVKWTPHDTADMPIVLDGVSLSDDYESDYIARRVIMHTLTFSIKARYYGAISDNNVPVIHQAHIDFWDVANNPQTFLESFAEVVDYDPPDVPDPNDYTTTGYIFDVPASYQFYMGLSDKSGAFIKGESLSVSGEIIGQVLSDQPEGVIGNPMRKSPLIGTTVTGLISGATGVIYLITIESDEPKPVELTLQLSLNDQLTITDSSLQT